MAEENRLGQVAVFVGAAALGIVVMIVLPKACQDSKSGPTAETKQNVPGKDAVSGKTTGGATPTPGTAATQTKLPPASAAIFRTQAVELSQKPLEEIGEALDELMEKWALTDPSSAAAWVKQLPAGDFRESAAVSLCHTWAGEDPKAAAQWVTENLANGALRGALGAVADAWARREPDAVAAWIGTLPDPMDRQAGEASLAQTWGETNPAAAAAWLDSLPVENQAAALQNLMQGWAVTDAAAAATWLQGALTNKPQLPASTAAIVVNTWVAQDAGAVSRWLNALPEGPFYEAAATAFAQAAVEKSPKDALLWARSLGDPAQRQQSVLYAMEAWFDKDRDAFVAALPAEIDAMPDINLRRAVYDLLYKKDPSFKESMLKLVEPTVPEAPTAPSPPELDLQKAPSPADQPAGSPVKESEPK